jgi:kanamycin kinase/aminoglycoside 3'-phosphotransferase-3
MRQPPEITRYTGGRAFTMDETGLSGASIAIFEDMVLKSEPESEESGNHTGMLQWLEGRVPAPKILETVVSVGWRWTLMTRIRGTMSCDECFRADPHRLVRVLAKAMQSIWTVPIAGCPVDQSPDAKLSHARRIVENGQVDMALVDPETFGAEGFSSPAVLLQWLEAHKMTFEPVLTHGDFCLPNVFLEDWELTGFLDLGRSGVGDRWTDIAILWRTLRDNFGGHYGEAVPGFHPDELFDALGIEKDEKKLRYYLLMDELF